MPRPDGSLYNFEKAKDKPPRQPKPKVIVLKPKIIKVRPEILKPDLRYKIKPTKELMDRVSAAVKTGLSIESSLVAEGMPRGSVTKWLNTHTHAKLAFEKAEGIWEREMVSNIHSKSQSDYKAAAWLLERRSAQRWAPTSKAELTGKNGQPLHSTLAKKMLGSIATKQKGVAPVVPMESAG